jgi:hypothetical protein
MSNDELNRKIEFIVEQQAQFASDIQELKDVVKVLSEVANTALESASKTSDISMTLIERYKELAAAQTETQRTVDRLARAVLAHVGDGHGGHGPAPAPPTA